MAIPKPRKLTPAEVRELLVIEKKDITLKTFRELFGIKIGETAPKFNTYDTFTLPAGRLYPGIPDQAIETTIGKYLINLVVFPEKYLKKYGYENRALDKDTISKIEDRMGEMIMNNEMTTKEYARYLDDGEWVGMGVAYFLVPTMDYDINVPIKEVIDKRDELFEKYADGVKKGDSAVADIIENELLALAKKKIKEKGNEAYDFFEAGIGSFSNNYKKTSIMAGAIENPYTKKLDICKSNYTDGVDIKEYPKFVNLTVIGRVFKRC